MKSIIDDIGAGLAAIFVAIWWLNPFKRSKPHVPPEDKEDE